MLNFHMKSHELAASTPYWICTFANNQHDLKELAESDWRKVPFAATILSPTCDGTLAILDESNASPFGRIWCVFEYYVTVSVPPLQ